MKKCNRAVSFLFAGILSLGVGAGQCLAANAENGNSAIQKNGAAVSRDGSAISGKNRITQADRQAAAKRAREKGLVAPALENSTAPVDTTHIERGAKK